MLNFALTRDQWRVILLSSFGGMLEFYDFIIFVIFASDIGRCFFPATNQLTSLLHTFATFAIGYLIRPIGGIFFSHFGDRYGRKNVFLITMIAMAGATFLMALLPSYATLSTLATILFVLLRLIQGFAIGGEIPGAITFVKEHTERHAGFACGVVFMFINFGIFLANFVHGSLYSLVSNELAWRIAFFIGGVLAIVSYFLRRTLHESIEFNRKKIQHTIPLIALIKNSFPSLFCGFLIVACQATIVSMLYLYVPVFLGMQHYSNNEITWICGINLAIFSIFCAFWGWLSDFIDQRKLLIGGIILSIPLAVWSYHSFVLHHQVMFSYMLLSICCSSYTGIFSSYLAKLFTVDVRYSGIALSYNLGFAIFAGLSPLLATYLIHAYNNPITPSYLFTGSAFLGMLGIILSSRKISKGLLWIKDF